jgi:hypothetical protein
MYGDDLDMWGLSIIFRISWGSILQPTVAAEYEGIARRMFTA